MSDLSSVLEEKKALEKNLRTKEAALVKLTTELQTVKDKAMTLEIELQTSNREKGSLEEAVRSQQNAQANQIRASEGEARDSNSLPLLEEVSRLEGECRTLRANNTNLEKEKKLFEQVIRNKDKAMEKMQAEVDKRTSPAEELHRMEATVKQYKQRLDELDEENRTLKKIQIVKTQAIEKLTEELKLRENPNEKMVDLMNQLRVKDREIHRVNEENKLLQIQQERKDNAIMKMAAESEGGQSLKSWLEERRYLQGLVKKHQDTIVAQEKTVKSQNSRIANLQTRLDTLATALKEQKSRRGGKYPYSEVSATDVINSAKENGWEADANGDGESIPLELYEVLQRDVEVLRAQIIEKDNLLLEKDDTVEALERKADIITKARDVETKKVKKENTLLTKEMAHLKEAYISLEEEFKTKESNLKRYNMVLKGKLAARNNETANGEEASP